MDKLESALMYYQLIMSADFDARNINGNERYTKDYTLIYGVQIQTNQLSYNYSDLQTTPLSYTPILENRIVIMPTKVTAEVFPPPGAALIQP